MPGQTDTGMRDTDPPLPGGALMGDSGDYGPDDAGSLFEGYEAVAVVQVVSRGPALAATSGGYGGARPLKSQTVPNSATAVKNGFTVLRPTRFAVIRLLKGKLDPCLNLDVPGGTAGQYRCDASLFPARYGPGDKVLGLFSTHDQPGVPVPA